MLTSIIERLAPEVSGRRAYDEVAAIARHHRIQASPGYRAAAAHCLEAFRRAGVAAEVVSYPADGRRSYWGYPLFREWEAAEAELRLVEPAGEARKLADFHECPQSLVQRSDPTPPGGVEADLAVVDDADRPESYQGRDVAGKLVLVTGQVGLARQLAVEERGALGLIVDRLPEWPPVRRHPDLPDARAYTSFWDAAECSRPCFGFVLSPREGDRLRRLAARGAPVRLRARVSSRFHEGSLENVEAFLPGTGEEEVLVVAHLCHPRPSANDNASGCAALLEAARALAAVLRRGELGPPRRGVRFLLVPEMTGTFAYLATREERIGRTVAALNLDMVGQRQDLCGSSLQVERPPRATPGFAGDLAAAILAALAREGRNYAGSSSFALFRHAVTSFSGGSDHYVLSDPTVNVPCPMIIQFPDRFYHTSEDTLDKVDPAMLERVALLTAAYAYFAAAAGELESLWLAGEMTAGFGAELASSPREAYERLLGRLAGGDRVADALAAEVAFARRRAAFLLERRVADVRSLGRLAPAAPALAEALERRARELERQAEAYCDELGRFAVAAVDAAGAEPAPPPAPDADPWLERARTLVPRRRFRGPVEAHRHLGRIPPGDERERWQGFERDHRSQSLLRTLVLYWADGKRNLAEIADLVELETGRRDLEYLVRSVELLARLELVDL